MARDNDEKASESEIRAKYVFGKTLGKGASCRVVSAVEKKDKTKKVAVKIMNKTGEMNKALYSKEVELLSQLKHKNIVSLVNHSEDKAYFYIVTNLCHGGELFDRIVSDKYKITETIAVSLIRNILGALDYCHSKHIVHRDLKPENFVFESPAVDANIVLIDFGCAKKVDETTDYKDIVGTVFYLAPEHCIRSKLKKTGAVLKSSDVWSLGVICYVLMTGRPPFAGANNKEIFKKIVGSPLQFPKDVKLSLGFKDFVDKMLAKKPAARYTLKQAMRHKWIQGKSAGQAELNKNVVKYLRQFQNQSKLKKAITHTLAQNMSKEPEKEVRKHFDRLDKDNDGFLEVDEVELLLLDLGYAPVKAKEEAGNMIKEIDKNGDGKVDFEEFKICWQRKLLSLHQKYIHRVFQIFDDNGDGFIDANELNDILGGGGFGDMKHMIDEVDKDGDGKISFAEFEKAMKEDLKSDDAFGGMSAGSGKFNSNDQIAVGDAKK